MAAFGQRISANRELLENMAQTVQVDMTDKLSMIREEMDALKVELYSESGGLAGIQKVFESLGGHPFMAGHLDGLDDDEPAAASSSGGSQTALFSAPAHRAPTSASPQSGLIQWRQGYVFSPVSPAKFVTVSGDRRTLTRGAGCQGYCPKGRAFGGLAWPAVGPGAARRGRGGGGSPRGEA
mmetsp:Transcript_29530/g.77706  ORF Transcript_29530/g.77706 Transcript_29530/m.77706 type:complete len:181 (-) Transcript_29530:923-1465(-)